MASQVEPVDPTVNKGDDEENIPNRPKTSQQKTSFSETLNKFTSTTFNRRRTDIGIPNSITSSSSKSHNSRIPTPAGVDRSTSFFSTLNSFAAKSTASADEESPQPSHINRCRKISEHIAQTPFFSHQHQQQPTLTSRKSRESSVKIEQRGLMQPVHPPLPHSSTIGNLGQSQQSSSHTPSFMRPTTSSARRSSVAGRGNTAAPRIMAGRGSVALQRQRNSSFRTTAGSSTPSKTPAQARQVHTGKTPLRNDSLVSMPSATDELPKTSGSETGAILQDLPTDYSDGANFQATGQPIQEIPKSDESSKQPIQEISKSDESNKGIAKTSSDQMHHVRLAAPVKEIKKSNLKSKNKASKFSEAFSNLYDDDEEHVSKEEHENGAINPSGDQGPPDKSERTMTPDSSNPRLIHEAQPALYWLGRYTALSDRFRTGALPSPPSSPHSSTADLLATNEASMTGLSPGSSSNAYHPMHDTDRRNRRVYIHLRSLCTTDEARASLDEFKKIMEEREKKMTGPQGKAVKEKQGWLEGLMGKKKKGKE